MRKICKINTVRAKICNVKIREDLPFDFAVGSVFLACLGGGGWGF